MVEGKEEEEEEEEFDQNERRSLTLILAQAPYNLRLPCVAGPPLPCLAYSLMHTRLYPIEVRTGHCGDNPYIDF